MPKRSYTKTTTTTVGKRKYSRRTKVLPLTQAVRRIVTNIAELKNLEYQISSLSVGTIWNLNGGGTASPLAMAQGVATNQHIGRKIRVEKIEWILSFTSNPVNVPAAGCMVRCCLIEDRAALGANPAASAIWQNDTFLTLRNAASFKRFRVLHDVKHSIGVRTATGALAVTDPAVLHIDGMKWPRTIIYESTAGTVGDLQTTNLVFAVVGTVATTVVVSGFIRTWYRDE